MADQNKKPQANPNKQGGQQQGSRNRNQGSGMDDTLRTQQDRDEKQLGQQGQRSRAGETESMRDQEQRDQEQIGQGTRRQPTHTAHDRGVGSERRNVSGTDRESLDTEGIESETDIEDEDLDSGR